MQHLNNYLMAYTDAEKDHRTSHDLEDIITVVDGRTELHDEVRLARLDLQKYLSVMSLRLCYRIRTS